MSKCHTQQVLQSRSRGTTVVVPVQARGGVVGRSVAQSSRAVASANQSRTLNTASNNGTSCSSCSSCGCDSTTTGTDPVCCAPCACRPKKGIKQFRQGIVMTGCGKPPGACGFDPDLLCGQEGDKPSILENLCAPSSHFCDGEWFNYRAIKAHVDPNDSNLIIVDSDPIAYGPTLAVNDPNYVAPTLMYPESLRHGVNFLYQSWIDPCTCSWWRLRYDSCGAPLGYEQKEYETAADLEQALRDLRGFDSDTNNNQAAEACTSFVVAGVPSQVNLDIIGFAAPYIVTGPDYGYQVFILDTASGRYYRDPTNVNCTKPCFPTTCCDGAKFTQFYYSGPPQAPGSVLDKTTETHLLNSICFEFNAATCRYVVCSIQDGADLPETPVTLCILQCCFSSCYTKIGINNNCGDALAKPSLCCKGCCP